MGINFCTHNNNGKSRKESCKESNQESRQEARQEGWQEEAHQEGRTSQEDRRREQKNGHTHGQVSLPPPQSVQESHQLRRPQTVRTRTSALRRNERQHLKP